MVLICVTRLPVLISRFAAGWQLNDPEAIRQALGLPATVPCLDAISRAMMDLERRHPAGVLSARALLDAVARIDQQLLAAGVEQEPAIGPELLWFSIACSVAAAGDAPLQKADVISYDTSLLRQERETVYANPRSEAAALLNQRRRYGEQLLLLLPELSAYSVPPNGVQTAAPPHWGDVVHEDWGGINR
jgi:hypothetical protein